MVNYKYVVKVREQEGHTLKKTTLTDGWKRETNSDLRCYLLALSLECERMRKHVKLLVRQKTNQPEKCLLLLKNVITLLWRATAHHRRNWGELTLYTKGQAG